MELNPWVISIIVFVGVAALVAAVAAMFRDHGDEQSDKRLDLFTSKNSPNGKDGGGKKGILNDSLDQSEGYFEKLVVRISRLRLLFEQADTKITPTQFGAFCIVLSAVVWGGLSFYTPYAWAGPLAAAFVPLLPIFVLMFKRSKRFKLFGKQLPDALELMGRALRSGHSLASGLDLVRSEMKAPVGSEFGRAYDEQNLGIPLDEALRSMTDRIPNLDLKFFVTAVVLQRQTGGDLAEILDKIGYLIRERFKIHGQVQALTGEGRLSGAVLLGLPPCLFLAVWQLNPDYVKVLFTDELGTKMLVVALFLQFVGALVIRKIVNIQV